MKMKKEKVVEEDEEGKEGIKRWGREGVGKPGFYVKIKLRFNN